MARKPSPRKTRAARRVVVAAGLAAADALTRAAGEKPIDPEEDFGGEDLDRFEAELEAELEAAPPPPPPPPRSPSEQPSPPPAALVQLGDPPKDPLAAQEWLHRAMILSAHDAMIDENISPATRRKELRTISAAAAKLLPHARLYQAEQLIKSDRDELERRRVQRAGATLERRPTTGGAKVIPIGGIEPNR